MIYEKLKTEGGALIFDATTALAVNGFNRQNTADHEDQYRPGSYGPIWLALTGSTPKNLTLNSVMVRVSVYGIWVPDDSDLLS